MAEYGEICIQHPDKNTNISGDKFRALVSKLNHEAGNPLPDTFFNYADGVAMPRPSAIKFNGGKGVYRIFGIGEEGTDLLRQHGHTVTRLLRNYLKAPAMVERWRFDTMNAWTSKPRQYRIRRLVLPKSAREASLSGDREKLVRYAEKSIGFGIETLCLQAGYPCPDDTTPLMLTYDKTIPVRHGEGVFPALSEVKITLPLYLKGAWFAGKLTANGHGRILPA